MDVQRSLPTNHSVIHTCFPKCPTTVLQIILPSCLVNPKLHPGQLHLIFAQALAWDAIWTSQTKDRVRASNSFLIPMPLTRDEHWVPVLQDFKKISNCCSVLRQVACRAGHWWLWLLGGNTNSFQSRISCPRCGKVWEIRQTLSIMSLVAVFRYCLTVSVRVLSKGNKHPALGVLYCHMHLKTPLNPKNH